MSQDTTLPPLPDQRAEFETWAKRRCFDLTILEDDESDEYKELETESAWEAWQARAAIAAQAPQPLDSIEQYRLQMAGISTAAIGYWKEGDGIHPDYDTLALRDVAKLYAKYDALYKAQQAQGVPVGFVRTSMLAAAPQAEPVPPPATGAVQIIKLGANGSAFDLPGDRRAYTYKHQPGNLVAWRIGDASSRVEPGGDLIDRGLSLLKALEAHGFGVFELVGIGTNGGRS